MTAKLLSLLVGLAVLGPFTLCADEHRERRERDEHEEFGEQEEHQEFGEERMGVDDVLEFVGKHSPSYREALGELRRENPEEFEERVDDIAGFIQEYREARREKPEEAEFMLKIEVGEVGSGLIARRFHQSDNPQERERLREQLGKMLNQLFEMKNHAQERELHYLEREMNELRERLHRRSENRERIIRRRMQDLLDEEGDDWMDW